MKSFREVREELADKMTGSGSLPCSVCRTLTPLATMSDHGARCFPCYQVYCREPFVKRGRSSYAEGVRAEIAAMARPNQPTQHEESQAYREQLAYSVKMFETMGRPK
jgi:hypothetical protein